MRHSPIEPAKLADLGDEARTADVGRAFRKAGPDHPLNVRCDYCQEPAECIAGDVLYPGRRDLSHKRFWRCAGCEAHVGCHPPATSERGGVGDGTVPLGRLANAELRAIKQRAHAVFDPLFRSGSMSRREAYKWLSKALGLPRDQTHIGMFDVADCQRVIEAVVARDNE